MIPRLVLPKLIRAAKILNREKRRMRYVQKKGDYIEGLHIHHSAPKLYRFCQKLRIFTVHELDNFILSVSANTIQAKNFRLKYPQTLNLIDWYAIYRRNPPPIHFPAQEKAGKSGL